MLLEVAIECPHDGLFNHGSSQGWRHLTIPFNFFRVHWLSGCLGAWPSLPLTRWLAHVFGYHKQNFMIRTVLTAVAFCTPASVHSNGTGHTGIGDRVFSVFPCLMSNSPRSKTRSATQPPISPVLTPATAPSISHKHALHPSSIASGGMGTRVKCAVAPELSRIQEPTVTSKNVPVTRNSDAT